MEATENITDTTDLASIRRITYTMGAKFKMVLSCVGDLQMYKQVYQHRIGYSLQPLGGMGLNQNGPTAQLNHPAKSPAALVAAIGVPVAAALALLAATLAVWAVRRGSGRGLLGAMRPPGLGEGSTLVVTDIQVTPSPPMHAQPGNPLTPLPAHLKTLVPALPH